MPACAQLLVELCRQVCVQPLQDVVYPWILGTLDDKTDCVADCTCTSHQKSF